MRFDLTFKAHVGKTRDCWLSIDIHHVEGGYL